MLYWQCAGHLPQKPSNSLGTGKFHSMPNDENYSRRTLRLAQSSIGYLRDTLIPFLFFCCCCCYYCCDIYLKNTFLLTLTDFGIFTCNDVNKRSRNL